MRQWFCGFRQSHGVEIDACGLNREVEKKGQVVVDRDNDLPTVMGGMVEKVVCGKAGELSLPCNSPLRRMGAVQVIKMLVPGGEQGKKGMWGWASRL